MPSIKQQVARVVAEAFGLPAMNEQTYKRKARRQGDFPAVTYNTASFHDYTVRVLGHPGDLSTMRDAARDVDRQWDFVRVTDYSGDTLEFVEQIGGVVDLASQLSDLAERIARLPKGEKVVVPKYLREHGNPEAADKWVEMNEEHGDKFKKEAARGYVVDINFMKPDRSEATHRNKHFNSWEEVGRYADDLVAKGNQILNISV